MQKNKLIKLHTPKGEEVLVNFKHVSHCTQTNNNGSSLRFTHTNGNENLGFYLIVTESLEEIQNKVEGDFDLTGIK